MTSCHASETVSGGPSAPPPAAEGEGSSIYLNIDMRASAPPPVLGCSGSQLTGGGAAHVDTGAFPSPPASTLSAAAAKNAARLAQTSEDTLDRGSVNQPSPAKAPARSPRAPSTSKIVVQMQKVHNLHRFRSDIKHLPDALQRKRQFYFMRDDSQVSGRRAARVIALA